MIQSGHKTMLGVAGSTVIGQYSQLHDVIRRHNGC
jgi:hypothetical protein